MGFPTLLTPELQEQICGKIRQGNRLPAACGACGVNSKRLFDWRAHARAGREEYVAFFEACQRARDEGETEDVEATVKAARLEHTQIACPECHYEFRVAASALLALASGVDSAQRAKVQAANVALERLARRHPEHWSPRVTHTIDQQLDGLLNVAQRVLAPEVFELLLSEYVAAREGENTSGEPEGAEDQEPLH